MFARLRSLGLAAALLLAPAAVSAQTAVAAAPGAIPTEPAPAAVGTTAATADALATATPAAGPTHAAAAVAARAPQAAPAETNGAALMQRRGNSGRTLMIIGGAAFLAGLLIGDDAGTAVALGGAAVGLYGLYVWLQ